MFDIKKYIITILKKPNIRPFWKQTNWLEMHIVAEARMPLRSLLRGLFTFKNFRHFILKLLLLSLFLYFLLTLFLSRFVLPFALSYFLLFLFQLCLLLLCHHVHPGCWRLLFSFFILAGRRVGSVSILSCLCERE